MRLFISRTRLRSEKSKKFSGQYLKFTFLSSQLKAYKRRLSRKVTKCSWVPISLCHCRDLQRLKLPQEVCKSLEGSVVVAGVAGVGAEAGAALALALAAAFEEDSVEVVSVEDLEEVDPRVSVKQADVVVPLVVVVADRGEIRLQAGGIDEITGWTCWKCHTKQFPA